MIPEFSIIIQEDIVDVVNHLRGKEISKDKLGLVALRIFSTINMATGVVLGVYALTMIPGSPITGLFILALAVAWYAFNHDLFRMAKNASEKLEHGEGPEVGVKAFISNLIKQFLYGEGPVDEEEVSLTENTLFKPIWNAIRTEYKEAHIEEEKDIPVV